MATREFRNHNDEKVTQELNELASLIADFCDNRMKEFENIKETSDWADGYFDAVNTVRAIINGLPAKTVVK